jgi:hypothetical protein
MPASIHPTAIFCSCDWQFLLRDPFSPPKNALGTLPEKSKTGSSRLYSAFHKHLADPNSFLKADRIHPLCLTRTSDKGTRSSIRSPWQNGIAERWVGTARRECFDHVIAINEAYVRQLGREIVTYYHEDRTHLGLEKAAGGKADRTEAGRRKIGLCGADRRPPSSIRLEHGGLSTPRN